MQGVEDLQLEIRKVEGDMAIMAERLRKLKLEVTLGIELIFNPDLLFKERCGPLRGDRTYEWNQARSLKNGGELF